MIDFDMLLCNEFSRRTQLPVLDVDMCPDLCYYLVLHLPCEFMFLSLPYLMPKFVSVFTVASGLDVQILIYSPTVTVLDRYKITTVVIYSQ